MYLYFIKCLIVCISEECVVSDSRPRQIGANQGRQTNGEGASGGNRGGQKGTAGRHEGGGR